MKQIVVLVAFVICAVIAIANPLLAFVGWLFVALFRYLRKPQPTRRRVTTGRIAR